jgi:hypothetical protein
MDSIDTCLVALFTLITMIVSVFCDFRFLAESTPRSKMLTMSSESTTVGSGVGVCEGVGLTAGVGVSVGVGGRGLGVDVAVAVGLAAVVGVRVGAGVLLGVASLSREVDGTD